MKSTDSLSRDLKLNRHDAFYRFLPAFTAIAWITLAGCDNSFPGRPANVSRKTKPPLTVNAVEVQRVDSTTETVTYFGSLEPNRQAYLGFGTGGNIDSMPAIGDRFAQDDQIASLKLTEVEQQRSTLEQNIEAATSSQQNALVESLQAELAQINASIAAGQITAPFDCAIAETFAFDGGLVEGKKRAVKVVELGQPNVQISLPRRVARWINPQGSYTFVIGAVAKQGQLLRRGVTEDPVGNTEMWFTLVDVEGIEAAFGSTVECRFNISNESSGYWVPVAALNRSGRGIWSVMVIVPFEDAEQGLGTVQNKIVQVQQIDDQRVLVIGPIAPGELVVAEGRHRIVAGQTVGINAVNPESSVARNPEIEP